MCGFKQKYQDMKDQILFYQLFISNLNVYRKNKRTGHTISTLSRRDCSICIYNTYFECITLTYKSHHKKFILHSLAGSHILSSSFTLWLICTFWRFFFRTLDTASDIWTTLTEIARNVPVNFVLVQELWAATVYPASHYET